MHTNATLTIIQNDIELELTERALEEYTESFTIPLRFENQDGLTSPIQHQSKTKSKVQSPNRSMYCSGAFGTPQYCPQLNQPSTDLKAAELNKLMVRAGPQSEPGQGMTVVMPQSVPQLNPQSSPLPQTSPKSMFTAQQLPISKHPETESKVPIHKHGRHGTNSKSDEALTGPQSSTRHRYIYQRRSFEPDGRRDGGNLRHRHRKISPVKRHQIPTSFFVLKGIAATVHVRYQGSFSQLQDT